MAHFGAPTGFTIFWVPQRAGGLRRFSISRRQLRGLRQVGLLSLLALLGLGAHYLTVCLAAHRHGRVRADNVQLRTRLYDVQSEIFELEGRLWRMEQQCERLATLTALHDPERELQLSGLAAPAGPWGQVLFASDEAVEEENAQLDSAVGRAMVEPSLQRLQRRAGAQEAQLTQIAAVYQQRPDSLRTTPSIAPLHDYLLSVPFGPRRDPYTQASVLHLGVDLSANLGSVVMATGAGEVVEAGWREGGGGMTVVIDHGEGHSSLYGHLQGLQVQPGEQVGRGQAIGELGHSGRARGPQLHYEVRFFGVPQDPEATFVGN